MTWKQIETAREVRLWIGQVIVPTASIVGLIMANPRSRAYVSEKFSKAKTFVKKKFHKES